jgi:hypothetical protein
LHDRARAEEADAGDDLRRDARRIADALTVHNADPRRDVHEQRRADTDQNVGAEAGRLARQLSLEADDPAEQDGEQQLDQEIDAQDARDLKDQGKVDVLVR